MTTTLVARHYEINSNNIARIIKEEKIRTLANKYSVLIGNVYNRDSLDNFLRDHSGRGIESFEDEWETTIDKIPIAFVAPTDFSMRKCLGVFLTKRNLQQKGINPIFLYKVDRETGETNLLKRF